MSRRKDRQRLLQLQSLNANYPGFRGYEHEPGKSGSTPLTTATCASCGRKRNVLVSSLPEGDEPFLCMSCQEELAQSTQEPEDSETQEIEPSTQGNP
ncbi:hypothetical protein FIM02_03040 [SAR202 cluster bacterium AD-802-E10_MRT_200m]|nr:hypothetical protein [SAR202 cluster bacterium AD-802-E10_MRT_200m]